jgi:SAM-dependent methyltransferase
MIKKRQEGDYYFNAYFSKFNPVHFFYKYKIDKLLSFIPKNSDFLDAGSGSGILIWLATIKKQCKSVGVNINKKEIEFSSKKIPEVKFYLQDIRNLNLNKRFSIINCSDVIEHFNKKDVIKIFKNLDNHLKKNGQLILAFPSYIYIKLIEKIWFLVRKIIYFNYKFDDEKIHNYVNPDKVKDYFFKLDYKLIKEGNCLGIVNYIVFEK